MHRLQVSLFAMVLSFMIAVLSLLLMLAAGHACSSALQSMRVLLAHEAPMQGEVDISAMQQIAHELRATIDIRIARNRGVSLLADVTSLDAVLKDATTEILGANGDSPESVGRAQTSMGLIAAIGPGCFPAAWRDSDIYHRILRYAKPPARHLAWVFAIAFTWHAVATLSIWLLVFVLYARLRTIWRGDPRPRSAGVAAGGITIRELSANPVITKGGNERAYFPQGLISSIGHRNSWWPVLWLSSPISRFLHHTYWLAEALPEPGKPIELSGAASNVKTIEVDIPEGVHAYVCAAALVGFIVRDGGRPYTLIPALWKTFWWGLGHNPPMIMQGPARVYLRAESLGHLQREATSAAPVEQALCFALSNPPRLINSRPFNDFVSHIFLKLFLQVADGPSPSEVWVDQRRTHVTGRAWLHLVVHAVLVFLVVQWCRQTLMP